MEKINKKQLCDRVAEKTGFAKSKTYATVTVLMEEIMDAVAAGDEVVLSGFMKFGMAEVAERQGRNPSTGEAMTIPETVRVTAKPGKVFKNRAKGIESALED